MPIYEYECKTCCKVIEVFQRMTEDPLTTCPDCSGRVKKLVSMSSFQLKGGGWYADGYNNGSAAASPASDAAGCDTSTKSDKSETSEKAVKTPDKGSATPVASPPAVKGKSKESLPAAT